MKILSPLSRKLEVKIEKKNETATTSCKDYYLTLLAIIVTLLVIIELLSKSSLLTVKYYKVLLLDHAPRVGVI